MSRLSIFRSRQRTQAIPPETKQCSSCGRTKPASAFHHSKKSPSGLQNNCKECNILQAQVAEWRKAGIEMDQQRYDRMLATQQGRCAICGMQPPHGARRLAVDHDHKTNEVRGLLCFDCNTGIGKLGDDPVLLRTAADYIERFQRRR